MWSPAQQPCTVTITLLPRPRTVTLQEAGGTAQNWGARLLWERRHLPSRDPGGGSGRPLHQLVWSEALLGGELQSENLSFLGPLFVAGSLHCSCGVWLVKETPLSAARLRRGCCWVAGSMSRSYGGVCVCTRVPVKGRFLSPKRDRLSGRSRGQPQQQQQQPGLAAESPKEEGHQVLHRSLVWQEGKGPTWTHQQGGVTTRWVLHRSEGGRSACMSLLCLPRCPHEAPVTHAGCPPGRSGGGVCLL